MNLRKQTAATILTLILGSSAMAGEMSSPPCAPVDPGETQSPPCASSSYQTSDVLASDPLSTTVDYDTLTEYVVPETAVGLLQSALSFF